MDVWMPLKTRKKRFAIAHPADMPDTISEPPRPLYTAVMTVSVSTQDISPAKRAPDFLSMEAKSLRFTLKSSARGTQKSGFTRFA